jgi:hypothetical protein
MHQTDLRSTLGAASSCLQYRCAATHTIHVWVMHGCTIARVGVVQRDVFEGFSARAGALLQDWAVVPGLSSYSYMPSGLAFPPLGVLSVVLRVLQMVLAKSVNAWSVCPWMQYLRDLDRHAQSLPVRARQDLPSCVTCTEGPIPRLLHRRLCQPLWRPDEHTDLCSLIGMCLDTRKEKPLGCPMADTRPSSVKYS